MTRISRRLHRPQPLSRLAYLLLFSVCLVLVRALFWLWYPEPSVLGSGRRRDAKLAFFVQVSNTSVLLLPRLLKAIWHERNIYAIHFDIKIGVKRRARMVELLQESELLHHGNIILLDPEPVTYAGITMVLNTVNAMSCLLRASRDWDFFINLSGSDYPLVSAGALRALLGTPLVLAARLNFLQTQAADNDMAWFFDRRMRRVHVDTSLWTQRRDDIPLDDSDEVRVRGAELVELNASHPVRQEDAAFVKTEAWVILHRSFVEHVVDSPASRRLLVSFATARAADELFFGTLLTRHARLHDTVAWDGLRFVLWGLRGKRWARPAFLDQVPEREEVFDLLTRSGALFARKFVNPESGMLDHVDANMSGIAERDYEVDDGSVGQHLARVRRRLLCIAEKRQDSLCASQIG